MYLCIILHRYRKPLVPFSGHSNNCQHCLNKISKQFLITFLFIAKGQNKASYIILLSTSVITLGGNNLKLIVPVRFSQFNFPGSLITLAMKEWIKKGEMLFEWQRAPQVIDICLSVNPVSWCIKFLSRANLKLWNFICYRSSQKSERGWIFLSWRIVCLMFC